MTVAECFGCAFLAFGPPLAMFMFTIAHDPIRIIILIAAAFVWLLSLLFSSLLWLAVVPLRDFLPFGVIFSVAFQEVFRWFVYKILKRTKRGLQEVADDESIVDNKHMLAYVSGLGFGIISGTFALVNVLADMVGPGTMGLKSGTEYFFITSAAQTLCMILLHTFWSVIFFSALDKARYSHVAYVILSHLFVSCITLLNKSELYAVTLTCSYIITFITGIFAFHVAGGSLISFKKFITCK